MLKLSLILRKYTNMAHDYYGLFDIYIVHIEFLFSRNSENIHDLYLPKTGLSTCDTNQLMIKCVYL